MKNKMLLLAGAGALVYWLTRPKPVVTVTEVPPPNSGPVVNGMGDNIFNQPWRAQQGFTGGRSTITPYTPPQVQNRTAPINMPRYTIPTRPRFRTPLFFR